jgi:glyoxylase-like metal-dependent hydrolase (beta-lactamase superfamily II)
MEIISSSGGIAQTNCFVIADEVAKKAVLFDAPNDTTHTVLQQVHEKGWDLIGLWLTHGHFDHVADHVLVSQKFPGAKLLVHRLEEPKLVGDYPEIIPLPFEVQTRKPDGYVEDEQVLHIGAIEVRVLHTPGHAAGHVVYYLPREGVLVGGDMILQGSIGRTDLPDSDYRLMQKSLRRIMDLPEETYLLPGHGMPSTLRRELQSNCLVQEAIAATMK